MKKIFLLSALVMSSFAFSQHCEGKPEGNHKEFKGKMIKELGLSEEQQKQVNAIDEKYKSQEEALKTQFDKLKEQKRELRMRKKSEVEKIFTEEQKQKLKTMREKFHHKHTENS